jgi:hypothetical protein
MEFPSGLIHAPELFAEFWLNSEPLSLRAMRGYVFLIHFWDFANPSSLRTIPQMCKLNERYRAYNLIVVGVHSPAYPFGKDPVQVERAARRLGIEHPVALDGDRVIWGAYGDQAIPSWYVVDHRGDIRFAFFSEADFGLTERAIQSMIREAGLQGEIPELFFQTSPQETIGIEHDAGHLTPTLNAGYLQSALGNSEGVVPESTFDYHDPGFYLEGRFYANGKWTIGRYAMHLGEKGTTGSIAVQYEGEELYAVMEAKGETGVVEVEQDGAAVTPECFGSDICQQPNGTTVALIVEPRAYQLISNQEHGRHFLRLRFSSDTVLFYAFHFLHHAPLGAFQRPEKVPSESPLGPP